MTRIARLAFLTCLLSSAATRAGVMTGIDVLVADGFGPLAGARVGLITNHTGVDSDRVSTIRRLHDATNVELVSLFRPEHGIAGRLDIPVIDDSTDHETGLRIHSLYGETRQPTAPMLADIDTLVFDIQDIGTRFYTYISTLNLALEAAAEHGLRVVVLDRPNPIGGRVVAGPVLDPDKISFVGTHPIPVRHGMTVGELAGLFVAERGLEVDLTIVRLQNWTRDMLFDATGLEWIDPSPNMRSLEAALLYPGIGLLETTNLSVGRGTATPFELIGAPWLDGERLAEQLTSLGLPGIAFRAVRFTPDASVFAGTACPGVGFEITDRKRFEPVVTGLAIALLLRTHYPDAWDVERYGRLLGNGATLDAVIRNTPLAATIEVFTPALDDFRSRRQRFLLYD